MQSDSGKLFVGGISWDTNEERLKDYFSLFGEVVEAVIMKDRATGRARGFGFIVFADQAVADRVIQDKHNIDGRMVEAKKAVPRDDQNVLVRNNGSVHGSPGRSHTRKIFVGGLASTVTETDFKNYFDQFGTITDVVVMYDHNTLRPRGFGFITYDSEEAVENVLLKTFHELNGKLVEVKRAVPKELLPSPSPSRSPVGGYNHGVNRVGSFLDGYIQGYSPNLVGGYGLGRDGRLTQLGSVLSPNGHGYDLGMNFEPGLRPGYSLTANFNSNFSYGRGSSPYNIGNSNRSVSPLQYDSVNEGNTSFFSSAAQNLWGSGGHNFETNSPSSNPHNGIRSRSNGRNTFMNSAVDWGSSAIPAEYLGTNVSNSSGNLGFGASSNISGLEGGGYRRSTPINAPSSSSYAASNRDFDGGLDGFYNAGSFYNDTPWISSNSERDGPVPFGYGLRSSASDVPAGYVDDFTVSKSHSKEESLPRMIGFDITT